MWLNGASYYTEYPSYPYSEHYGRRIPSYFPREVVADYIGGYTKKNALDQYITHGELVTDHGSGYLPRINADCLSVLFPCQIAKKPTGEETNSTVTNGAMGALELLAVVACERARA